MLDKQWAVAQTLKEMLYLEDRDAQLQHLRSTCRGAAS